MNAITLFAGAGGADLGMQRAGVRHLACVEGDATACATLRAAGFPAVHAWIGTPPPGSGLTGWRWGGGPVDLLWASPPCQPYSMAGRRLGADDARDGWPATLEAIQAIRPKWVIIENVGGAPVEGWATALGGLFARYRFPCVSWATLDAANWGLPSHRTRQFLVAGPEPYRWPEPTHAGPGAPVEARRRLLPWVGFGTALGLTGVGLSGKLGANGKGGNRDHMEHEPAPTVVAIGGLRLVPGNGGHLPAPRCASEPAHTVTGSCPQYLLIPSAAVVATEEKGHTNPHKERGRDNPINRASDSLFLATGRRRLTWQECAILLGFPDDYPFAGGIGAKYRQIGNAVAPVMAEALVRSIPR